MHYRVRVTTVKAAPASIKCVTVTTLIEQKKLKRSVNVIAEVRIEYSVTFVLSNGLNLKRQAHQQATHHKMPVLEESLEEEENKGDFSQPAAQRGAAGRTIEEAYAEGYTAACEEAGVRVAELKMPSVWRNLRTVVTKINPIRALYRVNPEDQVKQHVYTMLKDKRIAAIMDQHYSLLLRLEKQGDILEIQRQFFKSVFLPTVALSTALKANNRACNLGLIRAEKHFIEEAGPRFLGSSDSNYCDSAGFNYKEFCQVVKDTMVSYRSYRMYLAMELLHRAEKSQKLEESYLAIKDKINTGLTVDKVEVLGTERVIRELLSLSIMVKAAEYEELAHIFAVFYQMEAALQGSEYDKKIKGVEALHCFIHPRICNKFLCIDAADSIFNLELSETQKKSAESPSLRQAQTARTSASEESQDSHSHSHGPLFEDLLPRASIKGDDFIESPWKPETYKHGPFGDHYAYDKEAVVRDFNNTDRTGNSDDKNTNPAFAKAQRDIKELIGPILTGIFNASASRSSNPGTSSSGSIQRSSSITAIQAQGPSVLTPYNSHGPNFSLNKYQFELVFKLLHNELWVTFMESRDKGEIFSTTNLLMRHMGTIRPTQVTQQLLVGLNSELYPSEHVPGALTDNCADLIANFGSTLKDLELFWLKNDNSKDFEAAQPDLLNLKDYWEALQTKAKGELLVIEIKIKQKYPEQTGINFEDIDFDFAQVLVKETKTALNTAAISLMIESVFNEMGPLLQEYTCKNKATKDAKELMLSYFNFKQDTEGQGANIDFNEYKARYTQYIKTKGEEVEFFANCRDKFTFLCKSYKEKVPQDPSKEIVKAVICDRAFLLAYRDLNSQEIIKKIAAVNSGLRAPVEEGEGREELNFVHPGKPRVGPEQVEEPQANLNAANAQPAAVPAEIEEGEEEAGVEEPQANLNAANDQPGAVPAEIEEGEEEAGIEEPSVL